MEIVDIVVAIVIILFIVGLLGSTYFIEKHFKPFED